MLLVMRIVLNMRMRVAAMCYGDDGAAAGVDVVCDDVHTMDT